MKLSGIINMVIERERLYRLKEDLNKMMEYKDPQTEIEFREDSILASDYNQALFLQMYEILDILTKIGVEGLRIDKRKKFSFHLGEEKKELIIISDELLTISEFVKEINKVVDNRYMKKISSSQILRWLLEEEYLQQSISDDEEWIFKIPTPKGERLGISYFVKQAQDGRPYYRVVYNSNAQKFIVEHIDEILLDSNIIEL
jgi:hypothetical protein